MNEKALEKKLRESVNSLGGNAIKFSSMYYTGMPDRIVLMPGGRIWFVELKSTGQKLSPRQVIVTGQLEKSGFQVRVIDSKEKLQQFLNEISK